MEGALLGVGVFLYLKHAVAEDAIGTWGLFSLLLLSTLIWVTQPGLRSRRIHAQ